MNLKIILGKYVTYQNGKPVNAVNPDPYMRFKITGTFITIRMKDFVGRGVISS